MHRKVFFLFPLCLITSLIFSVACSTQPDNKDEYLGVIPDNPLVIAKVNLGNLKEKSAALEHKTVIKGIAMFRNSLDEKLKEPFDRLIENPTNCGIDVDKPFLLAIMNVNSVEGVLAMAVDNESNLKEYFNTIFCENGYSLQNENGIYRVVDPYGEVFKPVAFDSDKLVLAFDNTGNADAVSYILDTESPKAVGNEEYSYFFKAEEDVVFYLKGAVCMPFFDSALRYDQTIISIMEGTTAFVTADFKKGEFVVNTEIDAHEDVDRVLRNFVKSGSGRHRVYVPYNALMVANLSLDFDAVKKSLSNIINIDALLQLYDIEKFLVDALSTEYTLALLPTDNVVGMATPRFVFVADCSKHVFDFIVEHGLQLSLLSKVADNVYSLSLGQYLLNNHSANENDKLEYGYNLVYRDGLLILLPEDVYKQQLKNEGLERNMLHNELFAGHDNAAFLLDINSLLTEYHKMFNLNVSARGNAGLLEALLKDNVKVVALTIESLFETALCIDTKNDEENSLKSTFNNMMLYYNDKVNMP